MILDILIILVIVGFFGTIFYCAYFPSEGETIGVCIEVKTEIGHDDGSPYNEQMRGRDLRAYRPIIRYTWEGREYTAKSFAAFQRAKVFPGDTVNIQVSKKDKTVVKIMGSGYRPNAGYRQKF